MTSVRLIMHRSAAIWLVVSVLLALPAVAMADEEVDVAGQTAARLSFEKDDNRYSNLWLTIARAGQVLSDAAVSVTGCEEFCSPSGFGESRSVTVRDLDGNGEPEVMVSLYSGGAHCCTFAQVYSLNAQGTGYAPVTNAFGNASFKLRDTGGQGQAFHTNDDRFSYRFTCYACSGSPVRILRFEAGRFVDRTHLYAAAIRADSRRWFRIYRQGRGRSDVRGFLAAWAADEYRLGHADAVHRELRKAVRRGWLAPEGDLDFGKHGRAYVRDLHGFLMRTGYKSPSARVER